MGWFEFILERYNYWIVIVLMMTGLYIVFARGNLVKKIVGLNVFQTSVFIFYITIGKIAGGTAPIYIGDDLKKMKEGGHGDSHGGGHDAASGDAAGDHGVTALHEAPVGAGADANSLDHAANKIGDKLGDDKLGDLVKEGMHAKVENDFSAPDLKADLENSAAPEMTDGVTEGAGLHAEPSAAALDKISNDGLSGLGKPDAPAYEVTPEGLHSSDHANTISDAASNAISHAGEIVYTNPLPHVLILTAIVVGVATTAVGLALAVRIREAYGTIEEDELEAIDNVAEFGEDAGAPA